MTHLKVWRLLQEQHYMQCNCMQGSCLSRVAQSCGVSSVFTTCQTISLHHGFQSSSAMQQEWCPKIRSFPADRVNYVRRRTSGDDQRHENAADIEVRFSPSSSAVSARGHQADLLLAFAQVNRVQPPSSRQRSARALPIQYKLAKQCNHVRVR